MLDERNETQFIRHLKNNFLTTITLKGVSNFSAATRKLGKK